MDDEQKQQYEEFRKTVNKTDFSIDSYVRRIKKPWGYEIHFTPDHLPYMGKMLHIDEGKRLSLQAHDKKQESWYLVSGSVILVIEDSDGEMTEVELKMSQGYTCAVGQKHRLKGGDGGGDVFEVSTPELGNTYRLEDDYNRSTETPEEREKRNEQVTQ